jgi:hypothetical protein
MAKSKSKKQATPQSTAAPRDNDAVVIIGTKIGALRSGKEYTMRYRSAKVFISKGFATLKETI